MYGMRMLSNSQVKKYKKSCNTQSFLSKKFPNLFMHVTNGIEYSKTTDMLN